MRRRRLLRVVANHGRRNHRSFIGLQLLFLAVLLFFAVGLALTTSAGVAVAAYTALTQQLPSPDALVQRKIFQSTWIYDRNGQLLYELWDPQGGKRSLVPLTDLPQYLVDATVATEDARFWENPGVDWQSIVRAFLQNIQGQEVVSGASTITMQLVRNTLFTQKERYDQSYARKIREALLAYQIYQHYSKEEILQMYLNEIFYGNLAYGVEAAAQTYFGKSAKDLTLGEATLLVGLPQAPEDYNPLHNLAAAKRRQAEVVDLMVRHGYLTEAQAQQALDEKLTFAAQRSEIEAPHFVMYVRELLERRLGPEAIYTGGLHVYTTIDLGFQKMAEQVVAEQIAKVRQYNANNAALVAIDPRTGELLAMVGSADYFNTEINGQINMATAERQPGSTLKPFTYVTAFGQGMSPATMVIDRPMTFPSGAGQPPYRPNNHDGKFFGPIRLRQTLAASRNIPALIVLQKVGIPAMLDTAHRLGITTLTDPNRYGLSVTLGGGEVKLLDLTYAYGAFATDGLQIGAPVPANEQQPGMREYEPATILKITNDAGDILYEYKPPPPKRVLDERLAYLITNVLSDDEARSSTYGRHSSLELSRPSAGKTGTTDDYRDGWTMGYTPSLVAGVWVGNADRSPMQGVYGIAGAGAIWHAFMERALEGTPKENFTRPQGIVEVEICDLSGLLPTELCPKKTKELFVQGQEPKDKDNVFQKVRINRFNGKLASPNTLLYNTEERVMEVYPPEYADWVEEMRKDPMWRGEGDQPLPPGRAPLAPTQVDDSYGAPSTVVISSVQVMPGAVDIYGSAVVPNFTSFSIEYGAGRSPDSWSSIVSDRRTPVQNGLLGRWEVGSLPGGEYTLRLIVRDNVGVAQEARTPVMLQVPGRSQPTLASVPNVVGLSESEARRQIETAGFANTYTNYQGPGDVPDDVLRKVPVSSVLSQTPASGTMAPRGSTVYIAVRNR
ncbi:MAG: PBP1A family penicillin-binding protein [Chloroflexi bacterium]|nr:PBP1A family penicillin-binding protein [Chloroflexota bacterium]